MSKKVYVTVEARLIIRCNDDDVDVNEILENMDYDFRSMSDDHEIEESEIKGWEVGESIDHGISP
jgi:hypothetical protein